MTRSHDTFWRALTRSGSLASLFWVVLVHVPETISAGTLELKSGGQLTGQVRQVDGKPAPYVLVEIDSDLTVAMAEVHASRVIEGDQLSEYRRRVIEAGRDGDAHYKLASWCNQNNLKAQHRYHLNRTIDLSPDHPNARAALQYVQHEGKWVLFETLRRSQGLVKDRRGKWLLPEVQMWREAEAKNNVAAKRWIKTIKQLLAKILRGDGEAMAEMAAIEDPLASKAIADELIESQTRGAAWRQVRMGWLRTLMRMRTGPAVEAIVRTGLLEPDDVIREEALKWLQTNETGSAVATYTPWLKRNNPQQVKTAARALGYFPQAEDVFAYIDAVITIEKTEQQVGGGTQAGFSGDGSGGIAQGSTTIVMKEEHRQPQVLALLREIAPGVDYGFNKAAWKEYFAALRSPPRSDLRRDR